MKLILKQYLAGLKERNELDELLPHLLSQMGLNVFLKPSIGNRQYGVDVGAFGKIDGETEEKVYLFSIKAGDLGRNDWNGGKPQDLRPSLDEIIDIFIPNILPIEYKGKKVSICLCFGGDIKEEVRFDVTAYSDRNKQSNLEFLEWNGDKLASYIEQYLLREELLPPDSRKLLRKSLAMVNESDISFKYFQQLIEYLTQPERLNKNKQKLMALRQIYLCLWILYSWGRDDDNLESAFLSSEYCVLSAWDMIKENVNNKNQITDKYSEIFFPIILLNQKITENYLDNKILPYVDFPHALSRAISPQSPIDTNIMLFNVLGRLGLAGLNLHIYAKMSEVGNSPELTQQLVQKIQQYENAIKSIISNNPMLFTPYKDDQAIDIILAMYFLLLKKNNWEDIKTWLLEMINSINFTFNRKNGYPCNLDNYTDLISHPLDNTDEYFISVTKGSILYPYISVISSIIGNQEIYDAIIKLKKEFLSHCNFQIYFFDASSESYFYKNSRPHGAIWSNIPIELDHEILLNKIDEECNQSDQIYNMSAMKANYIMIILIGCRHFRIPFPMNFLSQFKKNIETSIQK